ncbi:hypothetical protein CYG68_19335 [Morganella morganii]|uniref:DDE domain-containing protein n=1 Tax=Morganella morganii TaxID=582 RepID=A0A8I0UAD0_MORMO|nr:hypothetical protein [Morganella morganii]
MNNSVEHDHCAIKRRSRPMLEFKSFWCAQILLVDIELMHMLSRKQFSDTDQNNSVY